MPSSACNKNKAFCYFLSLGFLVYSSSIKALPIDWHGVFGVDTTLIDTFKRFNRPFGAYTATAGPQNISETPNNYKDSTFQSYKLRLAPSIIVNDSITFNAEMTTGYGYGGFLGDSSENQDASTTNEFGNALYFHNTYRSNSNIILTKFYAEIFSDTGTYLLGRQPFHWGLGAVFNDGEQVWDRHATVKDGLVSKFKLGNFEIAPYYFKIDSGSTLTKESTTIIKFFVSMLWRLKNFIKIYFYF